ncbi:mevalonate kinase [Methanonatronarchaeum sp. AMET-Sl]|uniref:mevalonate kinase n=1 Tax=Methanonatronarchaeum sp. AMET-Sl TaxID=3037654 RepID=UPI00244D998D|nr:mevalonate kinase [Methanonatronarchaeum sp. AMET-Sl]WGI17311.1 mevalonate kinase [Methanonatronarchaeum sp. AMET-Sl]
MIKFSAPGKVYLFGEHAVVYGEPALACAIDERVFVTVEERSDNVIKVFSNDLFFKDVTVELINDETRLIPGERTLKPLEYVFESIKEIKSIEKDIPGFEMNIESQLPYGGGLGSSAAVTVASIKSLSELLGLELTKDEIAETAYRVEKKVQKRASPCDTFTSTMGGLTWVETGEELEKKGSLEIPVVIGFTGQPGPTGVLVEQVSRLKESFPEIIEPVITSIGKITKQGLQSVNKNDYDAVGRLMNVNHGLLDSLGVGTQKLNEIVYIAREAGASGAKITGAGGGGCILAIGNNSQKIKSSIKSNGYEAFETKITRTGVREE